MVKYMNYLERRAVRYVQPFGKQSFGDLGDWLGLRCHDKRGNTAYFAYDALLMSKKLPWRWERAMTQFRALYEGIKIS
ncbi:hypothetical protein MASR1M31_13710 [Porphyromonadaceae bacterium]